MTAAVLLAIAVAAVLALVALAVPTAKRLRVPLPVVIAAVGLALGLLPLVVGLDASAAVLDAYEAWLIGAIAFDSQSLLVLFLPPLLFEMALAVNVRRLLDDTPIVLVMAVLAVVLATGLVGIAVWLLSPFGLVACLLLGAAISTTDPAAVVSTFREIGAPRRLLVILEGESLLNDAAAIALFTVLIASAGAAGPVSAGGVALDFLYGIAVGAASGIAVAWGVSRLYPLLGGSAAAETSITVALAYAAYLLAQVGLDASGVVAVVVAGLTTTVVGVVRMGPGNWRTVTTVWSQIGFWANTLILLLASALAPALLATLHWSHALLVLAAFAGAFLARALTLFGLLPGLSLFGLAAPMTAAQKTLVWWGGVRGAVTLLLAFSLAEVAALPAETRTAVAAIACGFVFLTLLCNAASLSWVARRLGLDQLSAGDLALRERIIAGTIEQVRGHVAELASERALDPDALEDMRRAYEPRLQHTRAQAEAAAIPFGEQLRLGLAILCNQESRQFQAAFEEGAIGAAEARRLRATAERIADAARVGGRRGYERAMGDAAGTPRTLVAALLLQRYTGIDRPLRAQLALRLTVLLETENALRELQRFVPETLSGMVGEAAAENLSGLLATRRALVREQIDAIGRQYPVYTERFETILLLRAAARRERAQYDRLFAEGVIGAELHETLVSDLEARRRALRRELPELDLGLSPRELIDQVELFAGLDDAQKRRLERRLRSRLAFTGETIVRAGERGQTMYVIASGVVALGTGDDRVWLQAGDFVGELAMLGLSHRRTIDVTAVTFCRLLILRRKDFQTLERADPAIGHTIREAGRARMATRTERETEAGLSQVG
jgi:CPA1 family monovalent cation:H+ antiporter